MAPTPKFPFAVVLSATDKVTGPLKRIGSKVKGVAGRIGRSLGKIGLGLAAASLAAGAALFKIVSSVGKAGDEIGKFSKRFSIATGALQEYRFVAERMGTTQETFNASLGAFVKRLGEAKTGSGQLFSFLGRADRPLLDLLLATTSTEEALEVLFQRMAQVEDPALKAALASAAFSRAGLSMVNMTDDGVDGLKALREEFRRYGAGISEDGVQAAEDFADKSTNLELALAGVRNVIAERLLPTVNVWFERMAEFFVSIRPKVGAFVDDVARRIPSALEDAKRAFDEAKRFAQPLFDILAAVVDKLGPMGTAVAIVAAIFTATFVPAITLATIAAIKFFIVVAANPFGLLLTAISLLILALGVLALKMRALLGSWRNVWASIKFSARVAIDYVARKISGLTALLPDWFKDLISRDGSAFERVLTPRTPAQSIGNANEILREVIFGAAPATQGPGGEQKAKVQVLFDNLPEGARVSSVEEDFLEVVSKYGFNLGL